MFMKPNLLTSDQVELSQTPDRTEERKVMVLGDPRKHQAMYSATFRQVGWLGQSGRVYPMENSPAEEPGSFTALWIEVEG
jgi:hypothetical protein